jgi:hypothetical protein
MKRNNTTALERLGNVAVVRPLYICFGKAREASATITALMPQNPGIVVWVVGTKIGASGAVAADRNFYFGVHSRIIFGSDSRITSISWRFR